MQAIFYQSGYVTLTLKFNSAIVMLIDSNQNGSIVMIINSNQNGSIVMINQNSILESVCHAIHKNQL